MNYAYHPHPGRMLRQFSRLSVLIGVVAIISLAPCAIAQAQQPSAQQMAQMRIAALKEQLQASQAQLRKYQWLETTEVLVDGKVKKREQKNCYYDVTGKLQKVPVSEEQQKSGGLPGILPPGRLIKLAEKHKAEELAKYLQDAEALMHQYVPPQQDRIQQAVDAGNLSVNILDPGQRVRLDFKNYLKPGDTLGAEIDLQANRLLGVTVSSYVDNNDPQDAVTLNVTMSVLPDGTIFVGKSTLNAPSKNVQVVVDNSGYRKTGN